MKKPRVVDGQWEMFHFTRPNGKVTVVSFDLEVAQGSRPEGFDTCFRVVLHLLPENVQPGGLPVEGMTVQLEEIERDLVKSLETATVKARMVGRLTHDGKREMVFQVGDPAHFESILSIWLDDFTDFQATFTAESGWEFFENEIMPTAVDWQQVIDRKIIDKLLKAGTNPTKVHVLEHTLTGDEQNLQVMAEELAGGGFQVIHFGGGELVVQRASYLDIDTVSAISGALFRFANDLEVKYEGWGARIVQ